MKIKQPPAEYTAILKAEMTAKAKAEQERKEIDEFKQKEKSILFKQVAWALEPYKNVEIEPGFIITLQLNPQIHRILLLVNKNIWLRFNIQREYSSCSCENVCDCVVTSWLNIDINQVHKADGEHWCSFVSRQDLGDPAAVARAMVQMMADYKREYSK